MCMSLCGKMWTSVSNTYSPPAVFMQYSKPYNMAPYTGLHARSVWRVNARDTFNLGVGCAYIISTAVSQRASLQPTNEVGRKGWWLRFLRGTGHSTWTRRRRRLIFWSLRLPKHGYEDAATGCKRKDDGEKLSKLKQTLCLSIGNFVVQLPCFQFTASDCSAEALHNVIISVQGRTAAKLDGKEPRTTKEALLCQCTQFRDGYRCEPYDSQLQPRCKNFFLTLAAAKWWNWRHDK